MPPNIAVSFPTPLNNRNKQMHIPPHLLIAAQAEAKVRRDNTTGGVDVFPSEASERHFHLYGFRDQELTRAASEISAIESLNPDVRFVFLAKCEDKSLARVEDRANNPCVRKALSEHLGSSVEIDWVLPAPSALPKARLTKTMFALAGLSLAITGAIYTLLLASLG
ncbi:MAG: hypothetical protein ACR2NF_03250 [Pirellulales bacterium]